VRAWLRSGAGGTSHQGFPVTTGDEHLVGVVTRRDLLGDEDDDVRVRSVVKRSAVVIYADNTLREAADHMVREGVGRLAVVTRAEPTQIVGVITRSDLLAGHTRRLRGLDRAERLLRPGSAAGSRPRT
jgi:CBS domain-containing protein